MNFDVSTLFWILFAVLALQPILTARLFTARRAAAIRAIEAKNRSRVITMIHRQESRSLFGMRVSRHIDLEDAQSIIAAIKETPPTMPIDLIIHTPGGLVLAAMQIARAVEAHPAKVSVYVPVYAMSGGTLMVWLLVWIASIGTPAAMRPCSGISITSFAAMGIWRAGAAGACATGGAGDGRTASHTATRLSTTVSAISA